MEERSGCVKQRRFLIFNLPWHFVFVTNLHFTHDVMKTILFVLRWYHLGNAEVHHFVSVFGMLAHWNTKYHHYVISCYLIVLTFYLWLNRGLPRTIASPSPTLLEFTKRLRCLSFATIHSQMRWTSCHRTQRASSYGKWRLHVFYVRTLRFNYHLW